MYVLVRKFKTDPELTDEMLRLVTEALVPRAVETRGFIEYELFVVEPGIVGSVGLWEDEAAADEFAAMADKWRREELEHPLEPLDVFKAEIREHRMREPKAA